MLTFQRAKASAAIQVTAIFCAGLLLSPVISHSLATDRWALLILALVSAVTILLAPHKAGHVGPLIAIGRIPIIISALVILVVGLVLGIQKTAFLAGILLLLIGLMGEGNYRLFQILGAFLCLCVLVPLPSGLETAVGTWLARQEAALFVTMGQMLGLPIHQFGGQIISGETAVTVNSDCSGTLLFWPAFLGCLMAASARRRAFSSWLAIICFSLPFALLVNLLRFAILLGLNFQAPEQFVAVFHDYLGWFVMPLVWAVPIAIFAMPLTIQWQPVRDKASATVAVVSGILGCLVGLQTERSYNGSAAQSPLELPYYVAGWVGKNAPISASEIRILDASFLARRLYVSRVGQRRILLTMIFHSDAQQAAEHSSAKCFEALGWTVYEQNSALIEPGIRINRLLVRSHEHVQAVSEVLVQPSRLPPGLSKGTMRFQFVEDHTVPSAERSKAIMLFLDAVGVKVGAAP